MARPAFDAGRLLERISDDTPRGMIVHDRTRLIGLPTIFSICNFLVFVIIAVNLNNIHIFCKKCLLGVDDSQQLRHNVQPKMAM